MTPPRQEVYRAQKDIQNRYRERMPDPCMRVMERVQCVTVV